MHAGDGGNTEGMYRNFMDTTSPQPKYCIDAKTKKSFPDYQPQKAYLYETDPARCNPGETGCYCYASQPDWSAYREPSFGYGVLEFQSSNKAVWTWHRNQNDRAYVADQVAIHRNPLQCPEELRY